MQVPVDVGTFVIIVIEMMILLLFRFRSMWERYCRGVNAIVYMVDAADQDKIEVHHCHHHHRRRHRLSDDCAVSAFYGLGHL